MPRLCKNSEKRTKGGICTRCRKPLSGIDLLVAKAWNDDSPSTSTRRRNDRKRRRPIRVKKSDLLDAISSGSSDGDDSYYVKKKCPENKVPIKKDQLSAVIIHKNPRFEAPEQRNSSEMKIERGSNGTPESETVQQKCESELDQDCKGPQQNFSASYSTIDVDMQNKAINCNINEETMDGQIVQFIGSSSDENPLTIINTDASVQTAHLSRSFHFLDDYDADLIAFIRSLHRIVRSLNFYLYDLGRRQQHYMGQCEKLKYFFGDKISFEIIFVTLTDDLIDTNMYHKVQ
uniref:Uncharacterized protein n=1 Tax=Glossina austeni TaxID=7395 RepID=A0A1A9VIW1_GLOAU